MIRVGVLYGGRSGEHEVSKCSAASVYMNLDRTKYDVFAIGIDKDGKWYPQNKAEIVDDKDFGHVLSLKKEGKWLVNHFYENGKLNLYNLENGDKFSVDIVFPVVHGTFCEDGTLQGLLELAMVPYVGADVLGSSVGMDKDAAKRLLKEGGIPVVPWITISKHAWENSREFIIEGIKMEIGFPFFVKPANTGSSVGVFKVKKEADAEKMIKRAFEFDIKVLVEKAVDCREIECSVMGNYEPQGSVLGEIIPNHEFYSYEAKYIDTNGAKTEIPAKLPEKLSKKIRDCAVTAYSLLYLKGMARVDFFLEKGTDNFYLNEVNTLPGFTSISMYPKLWSHTGITYSKLLDHLIELAVSRNAEKVSILTDIK